MRQPIGSALNVVRRIVKELGPDRGIPTVDELFAIVEEFERTEFDVPGADSDGFLFQHGDVSWLVESTFSVSFVRQLEIVDFEGEYEAYSQVNLEFRYRLDADLKSSNSYNSWWFRSDATPFEEWMAAVKRDPVWSLVQGKSPVEFDVSQDLV